MVAYSFKSMFAEPIITGTKRQTIRAVGKRRHARPGEVVQLYTGMRTKQCRLIGTATCIAVDRVQIFFHPPRVDRDGIKRFNLETFARMDGFRDWTEMERFWLVNHGKKMRLGGRRSSLVHQDFDGVLIQWAGFTPR